MDNLKEITYFIRGEKYKIKAKFCTNMFSQGTGLSFRKSSPPLFFVFKKERNLAITSLFCIPFKAIWLDENMNALKILDVKTWKFSIPGYGKYLLEIPLTPKK